VNRRLWLSERRHAEAKQMLGRTPGDIIAMRPMKDGVIADFQASEEMLKYFILKVHRRKTFVRPRVVVSVPTGITEVERKAVRTAAEHAGASEVYLIEEPMAAAIGAGLPVQEPIGNMIVDVGGGTSEVAVISLGGIVTGKSVRVGGDEMDEAIIRHMKDVHDLVIGERTAEEIKIKIGSAYPLPDFKEEMVVRGRDVNTGLPRTVTVTSDEIREAVQEPVRVILQVIKSTLEQTPPELAADLVDTGIVLAGGGALLRGLDRFIEHETGLPTRLSEHPLDGVALGAGRVLEELDSLQEVLRE